MKLRTVEFSSKVSFRGTLALALTAILLESLPLAAQVVDFNDGTDTGFTRYDPIALAGGGTVGSWTFPGGNTYRLQSSESPNPALLGPSRAGSVIDGQTYSDFYVSVDVLAWNASLDQALGIMARVTEVGPGTADGYSMTFEPQDGDVTLSKFTNEQPEQPPLSTKDALLVTGRSYRFVFTGTGPELRGRVFDLTNGGTLVVEVSATDATYSAGVIGLIVFSNTSDGSGVTDATFDNYRASGVEAPPLSIARQGDGAVQLAWPVEAAYYVLQKKSDLMTGSWADVPPPYTVDGTNFLHEEAAPLPGPAWFYRLVLP